MLHRLMVDRGVQASVVAGGVLAVLASTAGLPWPLWAAWALATGWAVVEAQRAQS
ncbi:hypothetical protein [Nocardioides alcanivorans]|uniref:hypothetical protein n=1 Tax=Nocardioides alcanivorans TaxID=2897352 RepID=UPI001F184C63|nr:hypothetical protein [Nocardioides alcanivorans]